MSSHNIPSLEDRLSHAAEAKKLMLAKFRKSLDVNDPPIAEKRRQRAAIVAARAQRAAQREAARQEHEHELARQAAIAAQAAAKVKREADELAALEAAEQAERDAALKAEQKAARDARYAARKAARRNGGEATDPDYAVPRDIPTLRDMDKHQAVRMPAPTSSGLLEPPWE